MENTPDSLFPDRGIDDHSLAARVEDAAAKLGDSAYRQAIWHLAGADLDDRASRRHWQHALKHWREMRSHGVDALDLRAALLDYMHRVAGIIKMPCIVEADYLENLRQSSITDGLTGLYNQTHFKACLNRRLDRFGKKGSNSGAVLMLDLDRFKQFNDRCGHLAGDDALRKAGKLIAASLRQCDLACRYGGEEFIILLPNVDHVEALFVAERLRKAFEQTSFVGEHLLDSKKLTVSGGIALYPKNGLSATDLIDCADRELYQAKRRRNTISPIINDRHRAPRYNIRSLVEIQLPGSQEYLPALSFDISEIGIKIGCQMLDVPVDTISIRFRQPFWPTERELKGWIRWSRCRDTDGMMLMGLEFQAGQRGTQDLLGPKDTAGARVSVGQGNKPFAWMNG